MPNDCMLESYKPCGFLLDLITTPVDAFALLPSQLRFTSDRIDDTPSLASVLQSSAVSGVLELTVKNLPGDHVRPLSQVRRNGMAGDQYCACLRGGALAARREPAGQTAGSAGI